MRKHKILVKTPKDEVIDIHSFQGKVVFNWYDKSEEIYLKLDPNTALALAEALIDQTIEILDKEDDNLERQKTIDT